MPKYKANGAHRGALTVDFVSFLRHCAKKREKEILDLLLQHSKVEIQRETKSFIYLFIGE